MYYNDYYFYEEEGFMNIDEIMESSLLESNQGKDDYCGINYDLSERIVTNYFVYSNLTIIA